jgi:hypothetical protein
MHPLGAIEKIGFGFRKNEEENGYNDTPLDDCFDGAARLVDLGYGLRQEEEETAG